MSYVLIVDDEEDLRELLKLSVETICNGRVLLAKSGNEAVELVKKEGAPLACISDFRMADGGGEVVFEYFEKNFPGLPFRFCTGCNIEEIRQKVPSVSSIISKPNIHDPLIEFLEQKVFKKVPRFEDTGKYIPIRLSLLIRLGFVNSELYLKLSETNYVKVFHAKSEFTPEDGLRFLKKNVVTLHLLKAETPKFIHDFERSLAMFFQEKINIDSSSRTHFALEAMEATRRLIQVFGFQPETIRLTQQSLELAKSAILAQPELAKLLSAKLRDAEGAFVSHSTSTAFLACGLCHYLEWASDFTRNKLSLAALLHDLYIDEEIYPYPQEMNERASRREESDAKLQAYRDHPSKAAELLKDRSEFPPDVDHIIAQHHERPDGMGFPNRLSSSRIHPLAVLFIVVEDLVNFLGNREDVGNGVQEFLALRSELYSQGNFRKVMQAIAIALPSARKG